MKRFFVLCLLPIVFSVAHAQTVVVNKSDDRIKGESIAGFSVVLEGKQEDIKTAWLRFLKEVGKVKNMGNYWTISQPVLNGTSYPMGVVYATATGSEQKQKVWIGAKEGDWEADKMSDVMKDLESTAHRFGVQFYRDQIQQQINEAQKAVDAVEKQQQRLLNQSKSLNQKLADNDIEKIKLEKALEANKLENLALLTQIENNKKAQDSVAQAAVQIKKVVEAHQQRQNKVN
jgi:hypothetical protein